MQIPLQEGFGPLHHHIPFKDQNPSKFYLIELYKCRSAILKEKALSKRIIELSTLTSPHKAQTPETMYVQIQYMRGN